MSGYPPQGKRGLEMFQPRQDCCLDLVLAQQSGVISQVTLSSNNTLHRDTLSKVLKVATLLSRTTALSLCTSRDHLQGAMTLPPV